MPFETKDEALDALERTQADWLNVARSVALRLGQGGQKITIDDVRREAPPLPDGVEPRVYGAVFRGSEWQKVGQRNSGRRTCHKRPVAIWQIRGAT